MSTTIDMPPVETVEPKKSNKTLIIVIVVLVVLCCCCVAVGGGWYLWNSGEELFDLNKVFTQLAA